MRIPREAEIARQLSQDPKDEPGPAVPYGAECHSGERSANPVMWERRISPSSCLAMRQWLDHRHGVGQVKAPHAADGKENWDPTAKRRGRRKA